MSERSVAKHTFTSLQCTWATREPCKVMPDDLALQESQVSQSIKQGLPGTWGLDNLDMQCPALTARVHSNTADAGARTQRPSNHHYARSTSNTQHPTTAQPAINQSTNRLAHQVTKTKQPRNKATNQQPNQSANQTTTSSGLVTIAEVSNNAFFNELQGRIHGNLASEVRHERHEPFMSPPNQSYLKLQNGLAKLCSMSGIFTYIYHKCMVNVPYIQHVGMINEALGSHWNDQRLAFWCILLTFAASYPSTVILFLDPK